MRLAMCCLININGGEDVLMMLLKEGDSKSVSQIGKEIDEARKRIRQKKE